MFPASHHVSVALADQAATGEGTENAPPHHGLHIGKRCRIKPGRRMKDHACRFARDICRLEYPVDDAAMKVDVFV